MGGLCASVICAKNCGNYGVDKAVFSQGKWLSADMHHLRPDFCAMLPAWRRSLEIARKTVEQAGHLPPEQAAPQGHSLRGAWIGDIHAKHLEEWRKHWPLATLRETCLTITTQRARCKNHVD